MPQELGESQIIADDASSDGDDSDPVGREDKFSNKSALSGLVLAPDIEIASEKLAGVSVAADSEGIVNELNDARLKEDHMEASHLEELVE